MLKFSGQQDRELRALCLRHGVKRLELFGSAITDDFDIGLSDLDFLVEFEPMADGGYASRYFGLLEDLEQLFGRPVDLLEIKAVTNPYFLQSIRNTRISVYAA